MAVAINDSAARRQLGGITALATPILAASAVALGAAVLQQPESFAQAQFAVPVLVIAVSSLLLSITSGIWANYFDFANEPRTDVVVDDGEATADELDEAFGFYVAYRWWSRASILTFRVGFYGLLAGIGLVLVPRGGDVYRYVAIAIVLLAALVDFLLPRLAPKPPQPTSQYVRID